MKIAIPVYAILSQMQTDYEGGFREMQKIGYRYIEMLAANPFAGKGLMDIYPAEKMKELLDSCGLTPISWHEQAPDLKTKEWDRTIAYCDTIGCHNIVLPSIWIHNEEEALRLAEDMENTGKYMQEYGFKYVLHTHHFEHKRLADGRTLVDVILANASPSLIDVEYDIVWSLRGGVDPLTELGKYGDRVTMVHMKDYQKTYTKPLSLFERMKEDGLEDEQDLIMVLNKYVDKDEFFCNIGEGALDIPGIMEELKKMPTVQYVITESEMKSDHQYQIAKQEYDYLAQFI